MILFSWSISLVSSSVERLVFCNAKVKTKSLLVDAICVSWLHWKNFNLVTADIWPSDTLVSRVHNDWQVRGIKRQAAEFQLGKISTEEKLKEIIVSWAATCFQGNNIISIHFAFAKFHFKVIVPEPCYFIPSSNKRCQTNQTFQRSPNSISRSWSMQKHRRKIRFQRKRVSHYLPKFGWICLLIARHLGIFVLSCPLACRGVSFRQVVWYIRHYCLRLVRFPGKLLHFRYLSARLLNDPRCNFFPQNP